MKRQMSRQELIEYIARNNGYGHEVTEQFTTEELQEAVDSPLGAYVYITALLGLLDELKKID